MICRTRVFYATVARLGLPRLAIHCVHYFPSRTAGFVLEIGEPSPTQDVLKLAPDLLGPAEPDPAGDFGSPTSAEFRPPREKGPVDDVATHPRIDAGR